MEINRAENAAEPRTDAREGNREPGRPPCACRRWALRWVAQITGPWGQRLRLTAMAGLVLLALAAAAMSLIHTATAPSPPAPRMTSAGEVLPAAVHGDATPLLARYDCVDAGVWGQERPGAVPSVAILTYPGVRQPRAVPFDLAFKQASKGLADETLYLCGAR